MFLTLTMLALAFLLLFGPAPYLLETRASLHEESEPIIFCRECYTGITDPRLSLFPNIDSLSSFLRTGFSYHEPGERQHQKFIRNGKGQETESARDQSGGNTGRTRGRSPGRGTFSMGKICLPELIISTTLPLAPVTATF